jgi:hypothetical protein
MPDLEVKEPTPIIARKSEIDAQAEELRAKRELPKKPGDRVQFRELVEWLALLTEDQLARLNIYVYRFDPVIIRQVVDPEADNNIDVLYDVRADTVTEQYFIDRHGGGKYSLVIKDMDKPKTQKGGFFEARLYIPMTLYPPKLDLREVDWYNAHNKGFRSWAKSQGLIGDDNVPTVEKKEGATQQNNSDAMVQAMKLAMDFASKMDEKQQAQLKRQLGAEDTLGKSIGDILLEKMKQDDPNKQVATLTTLITAMKGMQPDVSKSDSNLVPLLTMITEGNKQFFTAMMENSKNQMTMMMELFKSTTSAKSDGTMQSDEDRLIKLLEIAKMMKGGPAPERSTAEVIVDAVTPLLNPVLNIVSNIMMMQAASKGIKPVDVTAPQQAVAPQPTTAATTEQPVAQLGNPTMIVEQKKQALKQFAPLITKALADGKPGYDFASDIMNMFPQGAEIVQFIVRDGVDSLLAVAKSVPEFWNVVEPLYTEVDLKTWISEFVNYKEELRKLEEEEEKQDATSV